MKRALLLVDSGGRTPIICAGQFQEPWIVVGWPFPCSIPRHCWEHSLHFSPNFLISWGCLKIGHPKNWCCIIIFSDSKLAGGIPANFAPKKWLMKSCGSQQVERGQAGWTLVVFFFSAGPFKLGFCGGMWPAKNGIFTTWKRCDQWL